MEKIKWPHRKVQAPRLRILIDPVYVQAANLGSSSTYQKYVSLVRELVSRGHFVYWMLPEKDEYIANAIEDHDNVAIIRTNFISDQFIVDGLVSDEYFNLFNRIAGKYHIDVICTSRTGAALMIKRVLEAPRFHDSGGNYTDKHYGLPMVVIEEFPQTPKRSHVGGAYWLAQCQGYLAADGTVFISEHNRSEIVEAMLPIYRQRIIEDWSASTLIAPSGIEVAELDRYYDPEMWKDEKTFKVLSVGRLMGVSYTEYLTWFDYLFKSGMSNVELTVSLSGKLGGPIKKKLKKYEVHFNAKNPQFKLIENNSRLNFLKMLRRYHAGIAPMSHLDCPVGLSEAIYLGVPIIMPVADYQQTFFRDYPFVIDRSDKAGLLSHLLWINENRGEARKMLEPWRDHIRETFDAKTNIAKVADYIEEKGREVLPRFKTSGAILTFLAELKGERYTFADIVAFLNKSGRMGISIGDLGIRATWTYGRSAIHHAMRYSGYVDTCDGPDDVFVRKDIFERDYAS